MVHLKKRSRHANVGEVAVNRVELAAVQLVVVGLIPLLGRCFRAHHALLSRRRRRDHGLGEPLREELAFERVDALKAASVTPTQDWASERPAEDDDPAVEPQVLCERQDELGLALAIDPLDARVWTWWFGRCVAHNPDRGVTQH